MKTNLVGLANRLAAVDEVVSQAEQRVRKAEADLDAAGIRVEVPEAINKQGMVMENACCYGRVSGMWRIYLYDGSTDEITIDNASRGETVQMANGLDTLMGRIESRIKGLEIATGLRTRED